MNKFARLMTQAVGRMGNPRMSIAVSLASMGSSFPPVSMILQSWECDNFWINFWYKKISSESLPVRGPK